MALLQSGQADAALAAWQAMEEDARQHPDALFVFGLISRARGDRTAAVRALSEAARLAPHQPQIWKALGETLDDAGDPARGLAALERATGLAPGYVDAWYRRGLVEEQLGRAEAAAVSFQTLSMLAPQDARAPAALGRLAQAAGNAAAAADQFRLALQHNPSDQRSRHNLAIALRQQGRYAEALGEVEAALKGGLAEPQTRCLHAHLLADAGRFDEAVAAYRALVAAAPDYGDAHETLARLLPQLGKGAEALDSYRSALARRPGSSALWVSAIASAKAVGDAAQMLDWARQARSALGDIEPLTMAEIGAHVLARDWTRACAALEPLVAARPDFHPARLNLAHALLASGDPAAAEEHAEAASRLAPDDQGAWSLLTIIWRLLDDPREAWLADYDRLVMPIDLAPPNGEENQAAWLGTLKTVLESLHFTREHPAEQTLRGGTQTRGNLFERDDPVIRSLALGIQDALEERLAGLTPDPDHPFLRRLNGRIGFAGSWSVRLRSEGYHVSHIHQSGWLSSACYISLPPEVGEASSGLAGALQFGSPDAAFGLDLAPCRVELPRAGRLVVFPSYFWHGTLPFESAEARLTVAFDALPV